MAPVVITNRDTPFPRRHFGPFAADLQSGELWKGDLRIRLQSQPFQVLKVFLERPNQLISREELQRTVWPSDTFVDFEQGLNKAINKLRDALGDSADEPRFIETVPKRGYRFIAPVAIDAAPATAIPDSPASIPDRPTKPDSKRWLLALVVIAGIVLLAVFAIWKSPSKALPRKAELPRTTSDPEAKQFYDLGRFYFFQENYEDVVTARSYFEKAIYRDPKYALAHAALGDTYDWMATEGFQPLSEVVGQATEAKTKANSLNPSLAEAHASLGGLAAAKWEWAAAESEFQTAIRLDPMYFEAHRLYSLYLRTMRRFPEAIAQAKKCNELKPLLRPAKSHLALTYLYAGQADLAAEEYRLILKDHPEWSSAHAGLAASLLKLGNEKAAIHEWQRTLELEGDDVTARRLVSTYERKGLAAARVAMLRAELQSFTTLAKDNYVSPVEFAYRYALLDEKEEAFRWLERAYSEHSPQLGNINVDPDYDNLRSDPRFSDLLGRLHVPQ